jgi:hypothetical protein
MATGFFVILDDIAAIFDDVATMSKVATKKTAGVLGDDLAVGAEKASGFHASRELPVLWAITKGSFVNKLIILPFAFILSAFAPWLIVPILMIGGIYLSYEGAEKIYEVLFHRASKSPIESKTSIEDDVRQELETKKIKSAILTDFILSVEIIMIALSAVAEQPLLLQIAAVTFVAILATIGVYGIVAILVRLDDTGLSLVESANKLSGLKKTVIEKTGLILVASLPKIIKTLSVVGTLAMLLVGGGIFVHNVDAIHHAIEFMPPLLGELMIGFVVGLLALGAEKLAHPLLHKIRNR